MNVKGHTSTAWTPPIVVPQAETLKSAAELLNGGQEDRHPRRPGGAGGRRRARAAGRHAGGADRQAAAGQGGRARRLARTRPAASACWARGPPRRRWRSATRLLIVGTSFPYLQLPAQARPGEGRADRPRPDPDRPALPGRRRPGRRRQGDAPGPPAAAQAPRRIAPSWRRPRSG